MNRRCDKYLHLVRKDREQGEMIHPSFETRYRLSAYVFYSYADLSRSWPEIVKNVVDRLKQELR